MTEHDGSHLSSILQQGQGLPGVDIGLEGVTVRLPARTRETMLLFSIVSIVASLTLLLLGGLWTMLPALIVVALAPVLIALMLFVFRSWLGVLRSPELLLTPEAVQISRKRLLFSPPERLRIPLDDVLAVGLQPQTMQSGGEPGSPAAIVLKRPAMFGSPGFTLVAAGGPEPLLQWLVVLLRAHLDQHRLQGSPEDERAEVPQALQAVLDRA